MSKISDLKRELRELRKRHCPPTGKMKRDDVMKEIERLKSVDDKPTEYEAPPPKPRVKKAKKEMKEMSVQADVEGDERMAMAERMAKVRAGRKIAGALKKLAEEKKEKAKKAEAGKKIAGALQKAVAAKKEKAKKAEAGKKIAGAIKKAVAAKKEKKEEAERESMAERMARVRAAKKVAGAVKAVAEARKGKKAKAKAVAEEAVKAVEKKKAKKEAEAMGAEDVDVGAKPKRRKLRKVAEEEGGVVETAVKALEKKIKKIPRERLGIKGFRGDGDLEVYEFTNPKELNLVYERKGDYVGPPKEPKKITGYEYHSQGQMLPYDYLIYFDNLKDPEERQLILSRPYKSNSDEYKFFKKAYEYLQKH